MHDFLYIIFFKTIVGKYFLVEVGYTNGPRFLAPYRGTRYHLNESIKNTPEDGNLFYCIKERNVDLNFCENLHHLTI